MLIIGEKINGAIPSVAEAIKNKDEQAIRDLVVKQEEAGIDYLDICAGTAPDIEYETICWLLDIAQDICHVPICIDSPSPLMIKKVLPLIKKPGLINSVSGEGDKCNMLFPLFKDNDWQIIALTCNDDGIPSDADTKVRIASELIEKADSYGITPDRLHIDPLVMSIATVPDAMLIFMEAARKIKENYPGVKITAGLSNISYGLPQRSLINQNFLTLALSAGLDSAIIDPLNRNMRGTMLAAEVLLGKDKHCRRYSKACKAGTIK